MKIKVLILEDDFDYLKKIPALLSKKYPEELQVFSVDDCNEAIASLRKEEINVFLAGDQFDISSRSIPKKCAFAFLTDSAEKQIVNGKKAICKYQKVSAIFDEISQLYQDLVNQPPAAPKTVIFASAGGGTGSSTAAASCAVHFASKGKNVLYLNFEKIHSTEYFFSAESDLKIEDIVAGLKNNTEETIAKLVGSEAEDQSKVCIYSSLDANDDTITISDYDLVVRTIASLEIYDYIVIDAECSISKEAMLFYNHSDSFILVSDGSSISNAKLLTVMKYIHLSKYGQTLSNKTYVLYNRFDNAASSIIERDDIKNVGGIPQFKMDTFEQLLDRVSGMAVFDTFA